MKNNNKFQKNLIKRTHDNLYLKENNYKKPKKIHSFIIKEIIKNIKIRDKKILMEILLILDVPMVNFYII